MAIVVSHHLSRVREEWSVGRPTKAQRMMQGGLRIARPMPMGSIVGSQMPGTAPHPFSGSPPETIPLDPPPLAQVLAQVRFSATPSIAIDEFFAPVQRALSPEYPIARKDQEIQFVVVHHCTAAFVVTTRVTISLTAPTNALRRNRRSLALAPR